MDFGGVLVEIESACPRICCPQHGVVVASVPWAFHNSGFTKDFEYSTAWLATQLVTPIPAAEWNPPVRVIEPRPENAQAYEELYELFRSLYPATAPIAHALAARQQD